MYTEREIRSLLASGESATTEFKRDVRDPRTMAIQLAAFANTEGGVMLVGVQEEPPRVVGADVEQVREVFGRAITYVHPAPEVSIDEFVLDGKSIAVVTVKASPVKPVMAQGAAYVRSGERIRAMVADEIVQEIARTPQDDPLHRLAEAVAEQTIIIEYMRQEMRNSGSWSSRSREWLISGLIGAVIGQIVAMIFG